MKMEITEKDIRLLKFMFTLLTVVLMVRFLILPSVERHQDLVSEREETALKREEMEYSIRAVESSRAAVEKTRAALAELSEPYYKQMEQREIDEVVTGLAYKHSLFPARLDIGGYTDAVSRPYLYSARMEEQKKAKEKAAAKKTPEQSGKRQAQMQPARYLHAVDTEIVLIGKEENTLAFLDDIERNYPSVQVRSFDIGRSLYMNPSMQPVRETQMRLLMTVYMCGTEEKSD